MCEAPMDDLLKTVSSVKLPTAQLASINSLILLDGQQLPGHSWLFSEDFHQGGMMT